MNEEKEIKILRVHLKNNTSLEFHDKNSNWKIFYDDRVVLITPKKRNGYIMVPFESIIFVEEESV
jgi:hypothetical protein